MKNEQVNDLIAVLEKIRSEKYPDVPADVIKKIVMAQFENQDNLGNRRSSTNNVIQEFLNSVSVEGEGAE